MSGRIDSDLSQLVSGLIPVVKARTLKSSRRSPESVVNELETLASLYVIRENLQKD